MARVLVSLGITKIRLTGGEPLLRKGVVEFVRELARLKPLSQDASNGTAKAVPSRESITNDSFEDGEALDIAGKFLRRKRAH